MFYDNSKSLIFKVLGVVVYCLLEKYVCVNYFFYKKNKTVYVTHNIWIYFVL